VSNLRDLKARIKSVQSTQKLTSAMKMVATSHLKRAQLKLKAATPYLAGLRTSLSGTLHNAAAIDIPTLIKGNAQQKKGLLLFITGERGLCSNYNNLVINQTRKIIATAEEDYLLSAIGKKGKDYFLKRGTLHRSFQINFHEPYREAQFIATYIDLLLQQGEIGSCKIIYTQFKSALSSEVIVHDLIPFTKPLLPLESTEGATIRPLFAVEPSLPMLLKSLAFQHLIATIFYCILSSKTSEEGARMIAMDNASRNAEDMIRHLQLVYNRTRQAHITRELIEIIAGAEAV